MSTARNKSPTVRLRIVTSIGLAVLIAPAMALAVEARGEAAPAGPSAADFAKLQREVAEQRQLIIQMLQIEQQRYDFLLRLMQSGGQVSPGATAPAMPVPPSVAAPEVGKPSVAKAEHAAAAEHAGGTGAVSGRLTAKGGGVKEAYVYLDQVKGAPAHGHTVEIKQKDKQFSPQVAVVQRGTTLVFPNLDPVFHNVFSPSAKNSFDLGSYRSGDQARSVVLTTPGVVEVFCNIHSRMNATILVVPSPVFAKVAADGTFKLENVPAGTRRIVAWSPGAKPVTQKVEVNSSGAQANFTLDYEGPTAHLNKLGQPYGSYKE